MSIDLSNMDALPRPTAMEAARFLGHATLGYTQAEVADLMTNGYKKWFDQQFAVFDLQRTNPNIRHTSNFDWLKLNYPPLPPTDEFVGSLMTRSSLRRAVQSTDTLTQRMTFALSEILVASVNTDLMGTVYTHLMGAAYYDMLQKHALGNYLTLLMEVSRHPIMARFLTFKGSVKEPDDKSSAPDENYARELLQLFTIGLDPLTMGGVKDPAKAGPTYQNEHVKELARIFTGWKDAKVTGGVVDAYRYPCVNDGTQHDLGAVTLGFIPGSPVVTGTSPVSRLNQTLRHIFSHPNVAPFISRQLIQRLVTSNPSVAYVERVANVFKASNGNLKLVAMAILMDDELFDSVSDLSRARRIGKLNDARFGKVREPWHRLVHWGRAFGASSRSGKWVIPYGWNGLEKPNQLGPAPMVAPSVFNFFRPGYVPPMSAVSAEIDPATGKKMVAPEFQIIDEVTLVAYVNFMQKCIDTTKGVGDYKDVYASYSSWLSKAINPMLLLDELDILLTAGRLKGYGTTPTDNYHRIRAAISTMAAGTDAQRQQRVQAAILMIMASPEYLVQQ